MGTECNAHAGGVAQGGGSVRPRGALPRAPLTSVIGSIPKGRGQAFRRSVPGAPPPGRCGDRRALERGSCRPGACWSPAVARNAAGTRGPSCGFAVAPAPPGCSCLPGRRRRSGSQAGAVLSKWPQRTEWSAGTLGTAFGATTGVCLCTGFCTLECLWEDSASRYSS